MAKAKSEGMVLAASNAAHDSVELLDPPSGAKIGERLVIVGFEGEPHKELDLKKSPAWEEIAKEMKTNGECVATYRGVNFSTSAGPVVVKSLKDAQIR